MKRRAHYNVGKGAGGGKYTNNIPDKKRNPRLRPVGGYTERNRLLEKVVFAIVWIFAFLLLTFFT